MARVKAEVRAHFWDSELVSGVAEGKKESKKEKKRRGKKEQKREQGTEESLSTKSDLTASASGTPSSTS